MPDWSRALPINSMPYVAPGAYRASAGFPCSGRRSQDQTALLLDGVFLNKIEVLGRPWDLIGREQSGSRGLSKMKSELNQEYLDIFRQSQRYGRDYWNAFIRALVADKNHLQKRIEERELSHLYVNYRRRNSGILWAIQGTAVTRRWVRNPAEDSHEIREFESAVEYTACGRNFCLFDDGRAG